MELGEKETVITCNAADIREGFVRVYTTDRLVAARIERRLLDYRLKGNGLLTPKTTHDQEGKVTSWDWRLPAAAVQLKYGGLSLKANRSPEALERAARRGREALTAHGRLGVFGKKEPKTA